MKRSSFMFCAMLIGSIIGLFLIRSSKFWAIRKYFMKYNAKSLYLSNLLSYDKTCGLRYWKNGKNFDNKDDIRFFSLINEILIPTDGKIIMIEFGANFGQFSEAVLNTPHETPYILHSLEPIIELYNSLKNRSMTFKKQQNDKHFHHNIGISDGSGQLPIYSSNRLSEAASLGKGLKFNFTKVADVFVTSLPSFIKTYRIQTPISFIKIDVEGFEPEVISGMHLETNFDIFPLFSFEAGGTWRDDRSVLAKNFTLKSFVTMLSGFGYDCFFIGYPYLLPITGINWDDSFDGFIRAPNVLTVLRYSKPWKNLLESIEHISLNSCQWS